MRDVKDEWFLDAYANDNGARVLVLSPYAAIKDAMPRYGMHQAAGGESAKSFLLITDRLSATEVEVYRDRIKGCDFTHLHVYGDTPDRPTQILAAQAKYARLRIMVTATQSSKTWSFLRDTLRLENLVVVNA